MSRKITVNPMSRVEGDLKIKIEIADGVVKDAMASGVMFRGFEKILKNHFPEDGLVYTPRICGICSISHSIAAASALGAVSAEFTPSASGQYAKNISHATENAMSHITQFYLYFAPDLLNRKYKDLADYRVLVRRFAPLQGESVVRIMEERKRFLEILGLIVGKWPHTLAIQPGGVTRSLGSSEIFRIKGILASFTSLVEKVLLGMPLREYLEMETRADLESAFSGDGAADLGLFCRVAGEAGLMRMGSGPGRFLSAGAFPRSDGSLYIPSGYWDGERLAELEVEGITESIRYSFFTAPEGSSSPFDDASEPRWDKPGAYSWAKSPRYKGLVVEVGALARQVISGDPLIRELHSEYGSTVFTRVFARLHEAVKLLHEMGSWIELLDPEENYYKKNVVRENGAGFGITEAARGFLGHWLSVENGRIRNYQVITPTAWNCSPRDDKGRPGALEQSLMETAVEDEDNPVEVDHVIRSYDPCLVCTVH